MPISEYLRWLRGYVGTDLVMSIGAAALIYDQDGRLLMQRRGDTGMWGIPGGSADPLENPATAVVREVWEETGLVVAPERVAAVIGGPDFHVTYPNGDKVSVIGVLFECRATGGSLRADGDESLELAYVDLEDIGGRFPAPDRISRYLRHLKTTGEAPIFSPPTWQPPANGQREKGPSPYIRSLRQKIGHDLLIMAGAAAIIYDDSGHVLMQRRGDSGLWGLVGGGIDPDETPADTVRREVWEETGLLVDPVRVIGVYGGPDFHVIYPNRDEVSITSILFECRITGGVLAVDGHESLELGFFPPGEIINNPDIPHRMRRRVAHAMAARQRAYFDPPAWNPPASPQAG